MGDGGEKDFGGFGWYFFLKKNWKRGKMMGWGGVFEEKKAKGWGCCIFVLKNSENWLGYVGDGGFCLEKKKQKGWGE